MSEHYTANTLEVTHWCNVCQRSTRHRVDARDIAITTSPKQLRIAGRRGPCLEHGPKVNARGENKRQEKARHKREERTANPELFA